MSIYFPVDVNFYDSPEFFEVNMSARGLWVTCGTWCKRHLTDGVPRQNRPPSWRHRATN